MHSADFVLNPPRRVQVLRRTLSIADEALRGTVDLARPYVTGLQNLPADGRFLLVGNHTQVAGAETFLIPHFVRRAIDKEVKVLADRAFGNLNWPLTDLMTAYGGVVGSPDSLRDLMAHDEAVLVFPGGGSEIGKFKGEQYTLRWKQREGFAREAVAGHYPIVPVGLVGSDDLYHSLVTRDSLWARATHALNAAIPGSPPDMAIPLLRGVGPTLIPRPQRMYLGFGEPIWTEKPARSANSAWVTAVRDATKRSLERILQDLNAIRAEDPFRHLNPVMWRNALQPPTETRRER